jgi:hypothetical protein
LPLAPPSARQATWPIARPIRTAAAADSGTARASGHTVEIRASGQAVETRLRGVTDRGRFYRRPAMTNSMGWRA